MLNSNKKSAFDILMNSKKQKEEKNKLGNGSPKQQSTRENETILVENKSVLNQSVIEIVDTKSNNSPKLTNPNLESNKPHDTYLSGMKLKRKLSTTALKEVDPCFLQHFPQLTDDEQHFLNVKVEPKFQFKLNHESDELLESIYKRLKEPLRFDFHAQSQDLTSKCQCLIKEDLYNEQVTFDLNNSDEEAKRKKETHIKQEDQETQMDTLCTTGQTLEDKPTQRYSRRRKAASESKTNIKEKAKETAMEQEVIAEKETEAEKVYDQELWTEKYQFKNEDEIVTNNSQLERLKEWLSSWKAKLSKEASSSLNTSRSSAYDSDSDYTCSDSDFSNSESGTSNGRKFYPNALLLSGPHGSGKTSSVYSAAKLLGFKVFEVNSSNLRGKTQILQELDGVLNSHHVSSNPSASTSSSMTNAIASFFSNAKSANSKKPSLPVFSMQKQGPTTTPHTNKIEKFFKLTASKSTDVLGDKTPLSATTNAEKDKKCEAIAKPRNKRKNSLRRETVLSSHKRSKSKKAMMEIDCDTDSTITVDESESEDGMVKSQSEILLLNENSNSNSMSSSNGVTVHKESLILFDEIDVVFKEDVGFWSAVNHFIKRSKKPIVLTTNDDFIQEKINLNIEKVEFTRPRIDSAIRFLKSIAHKERKELDTATAHKILRECKCDIRRALVQLQVVLSSTWSPSSSSLPFTQSNVKREGRTSDKMLASQNFLNLNKYLSDSLFATCKYHDEINFFNIILFLDYLTNKLLKFKQTSVNMSLNTETPASFKKYDLFLIRDGLTDHSNLISSSSSSNNSTSGLSSMSNSNTSSGISSSSSSSSFNPFQQPSLNLVLLEQHLEDLNKSNMISVEEHLNELYQTFITLFNENKLIEFDDWFKHGAVNKFNYSSNVSINKLAQSLFKFTSNRSISLDYRPYLHEICRLEDIKQREMNTRRRYMHYLTHLNVGLVKDDFTLLINSNLHEDLTPSQAQEQQQLSQNSIFNTDLFTYN